MMLRRKDGYRGIHLWRFWLSVQRTRQGSVFFTVTARFRGRVVMSFNLG